MIQVLIFLSLSFALYLLFGIRGAKFLGFEFGTMSKNKRLLIAILMSIAVCVVGIISGSITNYFNKPDKLISEYIVSKSIPNCESDNRRDSTAFTALAPYVIVEKTRGIEKEKGIIYKIIYYSWNKFNEKSLDEIKTIVFINSYEDSKQTYVGRGQFTATREGVNLVFTDVQTRECLGQENFLAPEFQEHVTYGSASKYVSRDDIKKLVEERIEGIRRPHRWWSN
jgi:hypothetical protein